MISLISSLFFNATYFMLRISNTSGMYPKPLNAIEEEKYLKEFQGGSIEARNILIERNIRLVAHVIKKYNCSNTDKDDLMSIGTIGLIKGVASFKPEKGAKLATYVARCIENEILMHFRSVKKTAADISLSEPTHNDKNGNPLTLVDTISHEDDTLEDICKNESYDAIYKAISEVLDERERDIVTLRFGLFGNKPLPQREVAILKNISRSYVSRIEKKALAKLSQVLPIDML